MGRISNFRYNMVAIEYVFLRSKKRQNASNGTVGGKAKSLIFIDKWEKQKSLLYERISSRNESM